jgi:hypothetical protein
VPADAPSISNPYQAWRRRTESVTNNPVRPDATQDRTQHTEQRILLERIQQFVVLADRLQNFVDHYWDLDHVSAKLLRDQSYENFNEVRPKLDLTVRDLAQVANALVNDLGHSPDDSKKVNEYLKELQRLSQSVLDFAEMQVETQVAEMVPVIGRIGMVADLARGRAIEAYHDVNNRTQLRLARLNLFFPEDDGNLATDPIVQSPPILPASRDTSTGAGGTFQANAERLTKGIGHDS